MPATQPSSRRRYELLDWALERGVLPDPVLRIGSRAGARRRERHEARGGVAEQSERLQALLEQMSTGPIAEVPEKANEQHYELPAEFLGLILGPRRKYSGCLWPAEVRDLAGAEEAMLAPELRAGAGGRRHADPRPRLRVGFAVAVARRAVPARRRSPASRTPHASGSGSRPGGTRSACGT